jgi:hypothetical protein
MLKLSAPYLPQAHSHGIGIRAASCLQVHIDPYPGMDEGDLIELFWNDCYVTSKLLCTSDIGRSFFLRVPESFLQNGVAKTYYRLMKVGGTPVVSKSYKLRVKLDMPGGELLSPSAEENQGLARVKLSYAVLSRGLTERHLKSGLPLSIKPYLNMAPLDEITLLLGDVRMDLLPLSTANVGKAIEVIVPAAIIREASDEPTLEMTYCVIDRVGNNSRWAPSRTLNTNLLSANAVP